MALRAPLTRLLLPVLFLCFPICLVRASNGKEKETTEMLSPEEAVGNPEKAELALRSSGHARFVRDGDRSGAPIIGVRLQGATDADLQWLAALPHLETLEIESKRVTDHGMTVVGKLCHLREVSLDCPWVTRTGLLELRTLAGLRTLHLCNFTIDDLDLLETAMPRLTIPRRQIGYVAPPPLAP